MKNSDDMSMEDILASIRKYVSSNGEPSKYDKKLMPQKPSAKVVSLKSDDMDSYEHEDDREDKKPLMFEKALSKAKRQDEFAEEKSDSLVLDTETFAPSNIGSITGSRDVNLMKFIKQSLDDKIQKWVDRNLEKLVEKRLNEILEKAAHEHISSLLKDE